MDDEEAGDDAGVWLTYSELAAARGIKRAGAIRLVQRQHWPRRAGSNDGLAHVLVPHDWAKPIARAPAKRRTPVSRPATSPPAYVAAIETAIAALREQQAAERVSWGERLTASEAERARLAEQCAQVAVLQLEIARLERAAEADRALGRWARLRRAWRGG